MASAENELHDFMEAHSMEQMKEALRTKRRKELDQQWEEEFKVTNELLGPPIEDRRPPHAIAAN